MQGRKQFVPKLFTNFQLPERVPEDNFYRHLKEVIDLRWLYKATAKYYGTEGQVSIDPVVFFRFMMIGYLENIISDRQIIETEQKTYLKACGKEEKKNETKDKDKKSKKLSNETHYSPTDPDACISTKTNKPVQLNYLGQVSVDTAHHVITNIEAHHADKRDSECLVATLIHTTNNLKEAGDLKVEEIICDGNYSSGETLGYLEQEKITGYIPNPGQYKSEREGFIYHSEGDYYTCSQGAVLTYKNTYPDRDGYLKKEYRSDVQDCKQCPLREQCLGKNSRQKKVTDTVDKPLYDRMYATMQTRRGQRMKKLRQSTVEPVIGTLVTYLGMRKVNTKGIEQANKCMIMSAVAYNLKKMMKWTNRKIGTCSVVMKKITEESLLKQIIEAMLQLMLYNKKLNRFSDLNMLPV